MTLVGNFLFTFVKHSFITLLLKRIVEVLRLTLRKISTCLLTFQQSRELCLDPMNDEV